VNAARRFFNYPQGSYATRIVHYGLGLPDFLCGLNELWGVKPLQLHCIHTSHQTVPLLQPFSQDYSVLLTGLFCGLPTLMNRASEVCALHNLCVLGGNLRVIIPNICIYSLGRSSIQGRNNVPWIYLARIGSFISVGCTVQIITPFSNIQPPEYFI